MSVVSAFSVDSRVRCRTQHRSGGIVQTGRDDQLTHDWREHDQPHGDQAKPCGQVFAGEGRHGAGLGVSRRSLSPGKKPFPGGDAPPSTGSRRRRIWDLPHQCHCPVVGVCLPLETLRRLANKALGGKAMADDYEVHVGAVAECVHRNRLAELMQHELDIRYARELKAYRPAKTTEAVAALWVVAMRQGDVAGAFWAALTHPRCDAILQEVLCRNMHMLQHQAGATVRIDLARLNTLMEENTVLAKELGKVQERSTRLLAEKMQRSSD